MYEETVTSQMRLKLSTYQLALLTLKINIITGTIITKLLKKEKDIVEFVYNKNDPSMQLHIFQRQW